MAKEETKKKGFKMPHLLWLMLGLIIICSLLTYVVPAGQFATDESGAIVGSEFNFLGYQTPVDPITAFMNIFPGLIGSAQVIFIVMVCGASIEVFLATKSFDKLLDWALYKMQGKSDTAIIVVMFILMVYLGAFGGSDALIAIVPIGIVFAKKLKLDNVSALGVSMFATMIGFGTGPTKVYVVQGLMGTRPYGAFVSRFIIMNVFMLVALWMVLSYINKIRKDPTKSLMYNDGWRPGADMEGADTELKAVEMDWKTIVNMILFIGQYVVITIYGLVGDASQLFTVMAGVQIFVCIVQGLLMGMDLDELGNTFARGLAGMAFVGFVIGMARTISIVLTDGNILHTIVYVLTLPLMNLPRWIATIGMTLVIAIINPVIPSATSKAAILVPIIKPIGEVLGLEAEMVVQTFQFGDGFTNIISPILGWTVGSVAMAKVPIPTWMRWAVPRVLGLIGLSCAFILLMTVIGWTGTI